MASLFTKMRALDNTSPTTIADRNKNALRYGDVKPYDFNCIDTPEFVNASLLTSNTSDLSFIAAQGPIPDTISSFWKMVYHHDVKVIVMLVDLPISKKSSYERGNCHLYWPTDNPALYDGMTVELIKEEMAMQHSIKNDCTNIVIRDFKLTLNGTSKKATQFHYLGWVDRSITDELQMFKFLNFLNSFLVANSIIFKVCVHCSAGCGRTGVFITLLTLMRLRNKKSSSTFEAVVLEYRKQRIYFIQTLVVDIYIGTIRILLQFL